MLYVTPSRAFSDGWNILERRLESARARHRPRAPPGARRPGGDSGRSRRRRPDRELPDGVDGQGRDGRRDDRIHRRHDRSGVNLHHRPRRDRHRRDRRRPTPHGQHLDDGRVDGGRLRRTRRQARQPRGVVVGRLGRPLGGAGGSTRRPRRGRARVRGRARGSASCSPPRSTTAWAT